MVDNSVAVLLSLRLDVEYKAHKVVLSQSAMRHKGALNLSRPPVGLSELHVQGLGMTASDMLHLRLQRHVLIQVSQFVLHNPENYL